MPGWPHSVLDMDYFGQRRRLEDKAGSGSQSKRSLEALQHHGHGQPWSRSFLSNRRQSSEPPPLPRRDPLLPSPFHRAHCYFLALSPWHFPSRPSSSQVKAGTQMRVRIAPPPPHASSFLAAGGTLASLLSFQMQPNGCTRRKTLHRRTVRNDSCFPARGWMRLSGLALGLRLHTRP